MRIGKQFGTSLTLAAIIMIVAGVVYLFIEQPVLLSPAAQPNLTLAAPAPSDGSLPNWLTVYFTTPSNEPNQGIDQYVNAEIAQAQSQIDAASFDLNLPSLVQALSSASQRGVKVRVVYDGEQGNLSLDNQSTGNQPFDALDALTKGGAGLLNAGRQKGIMHDKFLIIDSKILFTGSWNFSYNDTFRNNNNLLKITAPEIIANYQAKFEEMYTQQRFGSASQFKAPHPSLDLDGTPVETYFAPEDGIMAKIIGMVSSARSSIHFMAYTFTRQDLAQAMIAQAQSGLDVRGVIETPDAAYLGAVKPLTCAGLPVEVDGNPYNMHHKVIIIDQTTVITGSANFTQAADRDNDENVLVIHNIYLAKIFEAEFQKIYAQGKNPAAAQVNCSK
jgi:phosphatidylserine/phosphatidylglycerophosphate/cardiolipin synthase-like enzyme